MKRLLRDSNPHVICHFCGSTLLLVSRSTSTVLPQAIGDSSNFFCNQCDCQNVRDDNGELTTPDSALTRDPTHPANKVSFLKRGTSGSSHLPSTFASSPFCRTCISNQSLQLYLLASFPSDDDPLDSSDEQPHLMAEYRASLDSRYPAVCAACASAVEVAIKDRDYRAKAAALGWRLRMSKGMEKKAKQDREVAEGRWAWKFAGVVWKVRGVLWWWTWFLEMSICGLVAARPSKFQALEITSKLSWWGGVTALLTLLWTFWNPTWDRARRARARGKVPDVRLATPFIVVQALAFLGRLLLLGVLLLGGSASMTPVQLRKLTLGSLFFFLISLATSLWTIHIREPVAVHLIASPSSLRPSRARAHDPLSPLADLSLEGFKPSLRTPSLVSRLRRRPPLPLETPIVDSPTFGVPSLPGAARLDHLEPSLTAVGDNSMDWEPTPPPPSRPSFKLAPQRFFAPQQPSGLEGIFEERLTIDGKKRGRQASWWDKWYKR